MRPGSARTRSSSAPTGATSGRAHCNSFTGGYELPAPARSRFAPARRRSRRARRRRSPTSTCARSPPSRSYSVSGERAAAHVQHGRRARASCASRSKLAARARGRAHVRLRLRRRRELHRCAPDPARWRSGRRRRSVGPISVLSPQLGRRRARATKKATPSSGTRATSPRSRSAASATSTAARIRARFRGPMPRAAARQFRALGNEPSWYVGDLRPSASRSSRSSARMRAELPHRGPVVEGGRTTYRSTTEAHDGDGRHRAGEHAPTRCPARRSKPRPPSSSTIAR